MFSNQHQLFSTLKDSLRTASLQRYRVMLVLVGDASQHTQAVGNVFNECVAENKNSLRRNDSQTVKTSTTNIMHLPDTHSNSDVSDQINTMLGSEYKCVIFDANDAFDERLFAASAGTIVAGGLLILCVPSLATWAASCQFAHRFSTKIIAHHSQALLLEAANSSVHNDTANFGCASNTIVGDKCATQCNALFITHQPNSPSVAANLSHRPELPEPWQVEQDLLVRQLLDQLVKPASSVIVVQGDRGRGKSALIGRALHQLRSVDTASAKLSVTANRRSACAILTKHSQQDIAFQPIDQALQMTHDVLIVEEAGSIPLTVLEQLTSLSRVIVFATTVQGYEGAGRGFAIRFAKTLDKIKPGWLKLTPSLPVRWAPGDPLEAFINDAFLLKADIKDIARVDALSSTAAQVRVVDRAELASNDQLLEEIYGLLVQAHYQTTPADLRNILDQAQLIVIAQSVGSVLSGAALVALEGNIPIELHKPIVEKQRRLSDQLLPQLLAQSAAEPAVLSCRFARIVRIAVHPALQNRGFGTQLYEQLTQLLSAETAAFGASFGADEHSLSFWLKQGLTPVHYGHRANPRSGLRSACLLASSNNIIDNAVQTASAILHKNMQALHQPNAASDSIIGPIIAATALSEHVLNERETLQLIRQFCHAKRSFIDTIGLIADFHEVAAIPDLSCFVRDLIKEYGHLPPKLRLTRETELRVILQDTLDFTKLT